MSYNRGESRIQNELRRRRRQRIWCVSVYTSGTVFTVAGFISLFYGLSILPQESGPYSSNVDINEIYAKRRYDQLHSVGFIYAMSGVACIIVGFIILFTSAYLQVSSYIPENRIQPEVQENVSRRDIQTARDQSMSQSIPQSMSQSIPQPQEEAEPSPQVSSQPQVQTNDVRNDLQRHSQQSIITLPKRDTREVALSVSNDPIPVIPNQNINQRPPTLPYGVYGWYRYSNQPRWGSVEII